jgi:hypothetical protein
VTEGGQLLSGATLRFTPGGGDASGIDSGTLDARTNGNGEYALNDIELGAYRVQIVHSTRAMAFECDARIDAVQSKFDVDLPRATIEGRVVDEDGRPVRGIGVRVEPALASPALEAQGDALAVTDSDGRYVLRGVKTETALVLLASGGDYQAVQSEAVKVAAGEVKSVADLRLAAGAALEVSVTNADGRVAADFRVRATNVEDARFVIATTNASGRARFRGLRPGRWSLRAETASEPAPQVEVQVDVQRDVANTAALELR